MERDVCKTNNYHYNVYICVRHVFNFLNQFKYPLAAGGVDSSMQARN